MSTKVKVGIGIAVLAVVAFALSSQGGLFKGQLAEFTELTPPTAESTTPDQTTTPPPPPACEPGQLLPPGPVMCAPNPDTQCQPGYMLGQGPGPLACEPILNDSQLPRPACSMTNCELNQSFANRIDAYFATMHGTLNARFEEVQNAISGVRGMTVVLATDHQGLREQIAGLAHNLATMNEGVTNLITVKTNELKSQNTRNTLLLKERLCLLARQLSTPGALHKTITATGVCAPLPSEPRPM